MSEEFRLASGGRLDTSRMMARRASTDGSAHWWPSAKGAVHTRGSGTG